MATRTLAARRISGSLGRLDEPGLDRAWDHTDRNRPEVRVRSSNMSGPDLAKLGHFEEFRVLGLERI